MSLTQRRGGYKAQLTRIFEKVNGEINGDKNRTNLESYRHELSRQQEMIGALDSQILEEQSDDEDVAREIENSSELRMKIDATMRRITVTLNELDRAGGTRPPVNAESSVKLPFIKLLEFSGNSLDWQKFWDIFRSSVHNRNDISGATKFHYLVTQLKGEAEQLMAGFDHTDAEYDEAVALLQSTYGKTQRIIQARLHALFDLQSPKTNSTDLSKFRSLYEGHIRVLKFVGADVDAAGYVFAELLIRKLPSRVRDNLNRAQKSDFWKLDDLRKEIEMEIGHLQAIEVNSESDLVIHTPTAVFPTSTSFRIKCQFCFAEHNSSNCTRYNSVQAKRNRVNELKLCFNCLKNSHVAKNCTNTGRCRKCKSLHHTTLCKSVPKVRENDRTSDNAYVNSMPALNIDSTTVTNILPTAYLSVVEDSRITKIKAILDTGSQRTFILRSVTNSLNLPKIGSVRLTIDGFNSLGSSCNYDTTKFDVTTSDGILTIYAVIIDSLPSRINMVGRCEMVKTLKSRGLILADPTTDHDKLNDLGILIGVDFFFKLLGAPELLKDIHGIPSRVGTIIGGSMGQNTYDSCNQVTVLRLIANDETSLDDTLRKFWEIDAVDFSNSESKVMDNFEKSISFEDGKYSVGLPWKKDHPPLPHNYHYARARLRSNLSSLRENENDLKYYNEVINNQIESKFIEEVKDVFSKSDKTHYLAHMGVKKESSSTTPLRVVFDCSAKLRGKPSLNDCLYSGPNLINYLPDVLTRFRFGSYVAINDIKKAFLNIRLHLKDRDSTRFLWPSNPFIEDSPLKIYRFSSVLFGSTASPFLLNATLKYHLERVNNDLSREIQNNIYVDNLFISSNTELYLNSKKHNCTDILSDAGFSLHEWISNSSIVADEEVAETFTSNVLGIIWNVRKDTLSIAPVKLPSSDIYTKRIIVSYVASTFDPVGFLLPITIRGRLMVQDLWKSKIGWDVKVSDKIVQELRDYDKNMQNIYVLNFSRLITSRLDGDLHVFGDASPRAFGCVGYIKSLSGISFVMSKVRLAPISPRTLPELEFSSILLAVQLAVYLREVLHSKFSINNCHIWSDSLIALHWIKSDKNKRQFVQNRVNKINNLSSGFIFKYVSSSDNPADNLTRGLVTEKFVSKLSFWLNGPVWLNTDLWPESSFEISCTASCSICFEAIESEKVINCSVSTNPLSFVYNYSNYGKLIRITVYVLKFINNCRDKSRKKLILKPKLNLITAAELETAELRILSSVQKEHYSEIFSYLSSNKTAGRKVPPLINDLRLFLQDSVLRCGGRIQNSKLEADTLFPILLPPKSHLTTLIVSGCHNKFHTGINDTISQLRQKYWLPRARQNVKTIISKCIICKKLQGKPFNKPVIPPLPSFRVTESRAFAATCVDFTGALNIRDANCSKCYVSLFTCAVTRAIHLELVENLSAEAFILALRRFSSRRSYPSVILSDNASNFASTARFLVDIFKTNKITNFFVDHHMEWKFITPRAPWMGGVYERLIGIFKQTFKKVIGKNLLTFHELRTIIVEIEGALNDRPLTYVNNSVDELQPLTPSMLLCGHRIYNLPVRMEFDELFDPSYNATEIVSKRFKYCKKLISDFYNRWKNDYLLSLRETDRNINEKSNLNLKVGQVVLIHDDCNRMFWKLGVIEQLHIGADNNVRSADVRTTSGVLTRPIVKLYPLELDIDCKSLSAESVISNYRKIDKPVRKAAEVAHSKIKKLYQI